MQMVLVEFWQAGEFLLLLSKSKCSTRSFSNLVEAVRWRCLHAVSFCYEERGKFPLTNPVTEGPTKRCPGTGSSGCLTGYLVTGMPCNVCRDAPGVMTWGPPWWDVRPTVELWQETVTLTLDLWQDSHTDGETAAPSLVPDLLLTSWCLLTPR